MNIANKLTLLRVFLIPVFVSFVMLSKQNSFYVLIATLIFIVASLTDWLDGHLARKKNLISNFGKLLDPLADKLLVVCALICFIDLKLINILIALILISRELIITSIRLLAASQGKVIAANSLGKLKTIFQFFAIIFCLIYSATKLNFFFLTYQALFILSAIVAIISCITYSAQNKQIFSNLN